MAAPLTRARAVAPDLAGAGRRILSSLAALQEARMRGVLHRLSDADLRRIGIARRDIPDFAHRAVHGR